MTEQHRTTLKELQQLDRKIQDARRRIVDFDALFEEVEEPALVLESELGTLKTRAQEMKLEERRLELAIEERRDRRKRLDERIGSVRNLREEAAVSAELEMVKRSLQNDEQEAYTLLDQVRKVEERIQELESALAEARGLVEPKRKELEEQRAEAERELTGLEGEREGFVSTMEAEEVRTYDAIRSGGRRVAVSDLTVDGACGHCFGMIPLQVQNEIRHGARLIRCEACGVILTKGDPEETPPEEAPKVVADAGEADEGATGEAETADEALVEE